MRERGCVWGGDNSRDEAGDELRHKIKYPQPLLFIQSI